MLLSQENMGFGFYRLRANGPCLTNEERSQIQQQIHDNIQRLKRRGIIRPRHITQAFLAWPLRASESLHDYGYHGISNFVDHDAKYPDKIQDYMCGDRTYDLANGYNHQGTDLFLWPFSWNKMNHNDVEVVYASSGIIALKQDGHYDRSCGLENAGSWNAVYVRHYDGSVAWYGHLKSGSLTVKSVGDSVAMGEYLGAVGSSGKSTGPHLHFEIQDAENNLIDPYAGPCNHLNSQSWWIDQRPYYDSAINSLMTHSAPPQFTSCPNADITHEKNTFNAGDVIYFAAYYRDQLQSQQSVYTIFRPDSTVFQTWTHHSNAAFYSASYWYWSYRFPTNAQTGTWTFQVEYEGRTYVHEFEVKPENHAPTSVRLLSPENNDVLSSITDSVEFVWSAAFDADKDTINYKLTISGTEGDTLFSQIKDTLFTLPDASFLHGNATYRWFVLANDGERSVSSADTFAFRTPLVSSVPQSHLSFPERFVLLQNHPNPFNPSTRIEYDIPQGGHVMLRIFNLLGQEVILLVNEFELPGKRSVTWDGKSKDGRDVNSGVYVYQLQVGGKSLSKKMILIR